MNRGGANLVFSIRAWLPGLKTSPIAAKPRQRDRMTNSLVTCLPESTAKNIPRIFAEGLHNNN